ncbi:hypothetical protein VTJ49DRAFT_3766 [Mycothermus thermophilus]|uniref:Uncharacterized protein n=1 Tax=Humicola insolens TaxID=85995 RepID=A0ABR3V7M1_HUMIN
MTLLTPSTLLTVTAATLSTSTVPSPTPLAPAPPLPAAIAARAEALITPSPFPSYPTITCLAISTPEHTTTRAWGGLYTSSAGITATCVTLTGPDHILPFTPAAFYSASCQTYTYTNTRFWPAGSDTATNIYCHAVQSNNHPQLCLPVAPLTWTALVLSFFTLHLGWWILDLPLLLRSRDDGGGWHAYVSSIVWACFRCHAPTAAFVLALWYGRDAGEYARVYYLGVWLDAQQEPDGRRPHPTWVPGRSLRWWLCLGGEGVTMVAAGLTIYVTYVLPEYDEKRWPVSLWMIAALPGAVVGVCLLVAEVWFLRRRRENKGMWWVVGGTGTAVVGVGVVVGVVSWWTDADKHESWYLAVVFYGIMALPLAMTNALVQFQMFVPMSLRILGVTIAALRQYTGEQPFCKMNGYELPVVYIFMGFFEMFGAMIPAGQFWGSCFWRKPKLEESEGGVVEMAPQATDNK